MVWVDRDYSRFTARSTAEGYRRESSRSLRAEEAEMESAFRELRLENEMGPLRILLESEASDRLLNRMRDTPFFQRLLDMDEDRFRDYMSSSSGMNAVYVMSMLLLITSKRRTEVVSALPERTFTGSKSAEASDAFTCTESCVICIEKYQEGDKLKTLPCLHVFHTQCVDVWLQDHLNCPLCKFGIVHRDQESPLL